MDDHLLIENAFRPMGEDEWEPGPQGIEASLRQAAARYHVTFDEERIERAKRVILHEDPTAPSRILFARYLHRWDHLPAPAWAAGTPSNSCARRARIHDLLEVDAGFRAACDTLIPPRLDVDEPVVIAEEHKEWLTPAVKQACSFFYWNAYSNQLRGDGWPETSIIELDRITDLIVERLSEPTRREIYGTKGLVVGYVQSGKTANFTAVIAKAADLGYRLFIVLAGTLDILREQTQRRIDKELVGKEIIASYVEHGAEHDYAHDADWNKFVSHGSLPSEKGFFDWQRLTGSKEDYKRLGRGIEAFEFTLHVPGRRYNDPLNLAKAKARLLVVKKHPAVLRKLAADLGALRGALQQVPALVIDDESDQASIDTSRSTDNDRQRTATNRAIVALLQQLPRAQYIGYTATPFANVFINPDDEEDLFPKDYIIPLMRPQGYMGVRDFYDFGVKPDGYESNEQAFIREVAGSDEEPNNLLRAIDSFVLSGMIKLYRQDRGLRIARHHTMLVHRSPRQADHRDDFELVVRLFNEAGYTSRQGMARLQQLFDNDFLLVNRAKESTLPMPQLYGELHPYLGKVLDLIGDTPACVVNGDINHIDEGAPDFDAPGRVWRIVVGGTKLSRGYTVEGLTISYYRRKVKAADTLMQMGRWFGFRQGYRDLVRVFIGIQEPDGVRKTANLNEAFRSICMDEEEFRDDLRKYSQQRNPRLLPKQVPPLVASRLLLPTARNKMCNARLVALNFGGDFVERTLVPHGNEINARLLEQMLESRPVSFRNFWVKLGRIKRSFEALVSPWTTAEMQRFLRGFQWSSPAAHVLFEPVVNFLGGDMGDPGIARWLVILPQVDSGQESWMCAGHELSVAERGRDDSSNDGRYKAFSDPAHRAIASQLIGKESQREASPEVLELVDAHQGVMLVYPCRAQGEREGPPAIGLTLLPPENELPIRTKFTAASTAS